MKLWVNYWITKTLNLHKPIIMINTDDPPNCYNIETPLWYHRDKFLVIGIYLNKTHTFNKQVYMI